MRSPLKSKTILGALALLLALFITQVQGGPVDTGHLGSSLRTVITEYGGELPVPLTDQQLGEHLVAIEQAFKERAPSGGIDLTQVLVAVLTLLGAILVPVGRADATNQGPLKPLKVPFVGDKGFVRPWLLPLVLGLAVGLMVFLSGCATTYRCNVTDPPPRLEKHNGGARLVIPCKGDPAAVLVTWPHPVHLQVHPGAVREGEAAPAPAPSGGQ